MSSAVLTSLLLIVVLPTGGQDETAEPEARLGIGAVAPPLTSLRPLGEAEPLEADWEARRGEVWVLEFWATWCGPCIPALDHLARVQSQLGERPVRFLGISPEAPERMEAFLSRRELAFPVALDEAEVVFDAFGIYGVPTTVVVDAEGRIAACARPEEITRAVLERVLRGESAGLPFRRHESAQLDWAPVIGDEGEVFASVVLADSTASNGGSRFAPGSGRISGDGLHLLNLLQLAHDVPSTRMESGFPPWSREDPLYRVSVVAPGGNDDLARAMLAAALEVKFGYAARWEERESEAYVLRLDPDAPEWEPSLAAPAERTRSAFGGGLSMVRESMDFCRGWFENVLQKPVVDETGLTGLYDLEMSWVDKTSFRDELARVGLALELKVRKVSILVIEPL